MSEKRFGEYMIELLLISGWLFSFTRIVKTAHVVHVVYTYVFYFLKNYILYKKKRIDKDISLNIFKSVGFLFLRERALIYSEKQTKKIQFT